MPVAPLSEYQARLAARGAAFDRLSRQDERLSQARLVVFAAFLLVAAATWQGRVPAATLLAPAIAFGWLVRRHDAAIGARDRARRAIAFYERGLARIEDRWHGGGEPGDRFRDDGHLYANDLDLFGRGSLFDLLSVARTGAGEAVLAGWLKTPASPPEIRTRQAAVTELTPLLDLREQVALAGGHVRRGVHPEQLVAWAGAPPLLAAVWPRGVAAALGVAAAGTAVWWAVRGDSGPFVAVAALEILFATPQRSRVDGALHAAEQPARDLDILAGVLRQLEQAAFDSPRLRDLQTRLRGDGTTASAAIEQLHRLVEWHDWQHNPFFALIGATLLWGTQIAYAIEAWRRRHGAAVADWLAAVAEFEALGSLAAYRFEHPADPFPEIVDDGQALFDGAGLGHPLIPAVRMITNDVSLAHPVRLLVVSGSNMSGKSTLLRTVGINTVLALAGAPVRAQRLRVSPLALGATLRIQDSLQEGRSRFYAEITRVRELSDAAAGRPPLLFLLDEIFHGTNSHDRLLGAAGVLRALLDRGAIGLVTTHDLALTAVAADLAPRAVNVHFEDRFEDGELRFDYTMKAGPVTRSNAIALMRAVGLAVDAEPPPNRP